MRCDQSDGIIVCDGVSDCEWTRYYCARLFISVHRRIHHRKLRNAIKMQSDWLRLIRGAGTTRCIALYQTLSLPLPPPPPHPPPCKHLAGDVRVWLRETSSNRCAHLTMFGSH
jgi:hypothetical protein